MAKMMVELMVVPMVEKRAVEKVAKMVALTAGTMVEQSVEW